MMAESWVRVSSQSEAYSLTPAKEWDPLGDLGDPLIRGVKPLQRFKHLQCATKTH